MLDFIVFLDIFEIFAEDCFLPRSFRKFLPSGFLPLSRCQVWGAGKGTKNSRRKGGYFYLEIERGGFPRRGGGVVHTGAARVSREGGRAKYFFSGPKCPPRRARTKFDGLEVDQELDMVANF